MRCRQMPLSTRQNSIPGSGADPVIPGQAQSRWPTAFKIQGALVQHMYPVPRSSWRPGRWAGQSGMTPRSLNAAAYSYAAPDPSSVCERIIRRWTARQRRSECSAHHYSRMATPPVDILYSAFGNSLVAHCQRRPSLSVTVTITLEDIDSWSNVPPYTSPGVLAGLRPRPPAPSLPADA